MYVFTLLGYVYSSNLEMYVFIVLSSISVFALNQFDEFCDCPAPSTTYLCTDKKVELHRIKIQKVKRIKDLKERNCARLPIMHNVKSSFHGIRASRPDLEKKIW